MNKRIKAVRNAKKLTQTVFGLRIGATRNQIAFAEQDGTNVSPILVTAICQEYGVSETWLRTGEGEMFVAPQKSDIDVAMRVIADRVKRLDPDLQQEVYGLCRRILDQSAEPSSAKPKKTKNPASKAPKNK